MGARVCLLIVDTTVFSTNGFNAFATGTPFWGQKILGFGTGRGFGALKGLMFFVRGRSKTFSSPQVGTGWLPARKVGCIHQLTDEKVPDAKEMVGDAARHVHEESIFSNMTHNHIIRDLLVDDIFFLAEF